MATGKIAEALLAPMPGLAASTVNYSAQGFILGLPPQRDVGYVTDHTLVPIYIWNGSLADAVLQSIKGDEGAEGIAWDVDPPVIVPALGSQRVIVDVSSDGPLAFDGLLTFLSSCGSIVLRLFGTRAPHLSGDVSYLFMPHNWEDGLAESLAWKTEVMVAFDRTEQRVQLRTMPRRAWELRLLVAGPARRKLETWLSLRKTRRLFTPVWRDESRLDVPIAAGESVAHLDRPGLLDFAVGRWLAVYDSWDRFEIRRVTGIGAGYVAVDSPFEFDWPARSPVAPGRYGVALSQRRVSRFTEEVADWRLRFEALDESLMPEMEKPDTYRTLPVCPFVPSWLDDEETMDNKWVRLDNDTGTVEFDIQSLEPVLARSARFLLIGRTGIDRFLRFLFYCAGRLAPFWLPATERGFELAAPARAGENAIDIDNIAYEYALAGSAAHTDIELVAIDGTRIRRRIVGVETLPEGPERLTLDGALEVDIAAASLNRCAWLQLCRLDADEIDLKWQGGDCLEVTLPIMVLP
ncbi:MAG: hypothetical protein LBD10_07515 [Desulfobulbus sp.]|jgi:hypothetical protein|uniref:hypothetical protein n=1 Tax=Desulfobulbus sp. TaxID=895 RepID=UPI00285015A9|nr:hypothetical protein [Desulfobulbus sp.]MDR2550026.1 hypothetical protein [Desulfobulbus sp.]